MKAKPEDKESEFEAIRRTSGEPTGEQKKALLKKFASCPPYRGANGGPEDAIKEADAYKFLAEDLYKLKMDTDFIEWAQRQRK